jgi:hypothetical protein
VKSRYMYNFAYLLLERDHRLDTISEINESECFASRGCYGCREIEECDIGKGLRICGNSSKKRSNNQRNWSKHFEMRQVKIGNDNGDVRGMSSPLKYLGMHGNAGYTRHGRSWANAESCIQLI